MNKLREVVRMQILVSYTLNVKGISKKELWKYLEENSPMRITDSEKFEVSTERWELCE